MVQQRPIAVRRIRQFLCVVGEQLDVVVVDRGELLEQLRLFVVVRDPVVSLGYTDVRERSL